MELPYRENSKRKKVEDALQQEGEPELTQEEMDKKMHKEQVKQERVQRYARRTKEKEDETGKLQEQQKEDETGKLRDLISEPNIPTGSSKPKEPKPKNP